MIKISSLSAVFTNMCRCRLSNGQLNIHNRHGSRFKVADEKPKASSKEVFYLQPQVPELQFLKTCVFSRAL